MLLKQVVADAPFAAGMGKITDAWNILADKLKSYEDFGRNADGVNEEEDEKIELLDNVFELMDEAKTVENSKSLKAKEVQVKAEKDGKFIREMALQSLGKRSNKEDPTDNMVENRQSSLAMAIDGDSIREADWREKELSFKRTKLEASILQQQLDREERIAERAAEREHQLKLAQIESEKIMTLIKALADSKK
ncbi:hypothetical protein AC1031_018423 [Aphanomyces cochlioides]|nr:hypothetical protein AC1031_018423 [Aphanomyces cochlioides]